MNLFITLLATLLATAGPDLPPGVFANDYVAPFTPYGQQRLGEALQAVFDRREPGRPFPALVSCLSHLLTLIQEGGPLP